MQSRGNSSQRSRTKLSRKNLRQWFRRWCDEWRLALSGVVLATRQRSFLIAFALSFIIFGTLMSLLSSSAAPLTLFWASSLERKLKIIWDGFLGIFIIDGNFWSWILSFMIIICQSILIGLIALVWQRRRRSRKAQLAATATNVNHIERAGVTVGLALLGSGCPACGTTLFTPVLGALLSTSGFALADTVAGILTVITLIALVVSLLSIKHLGNDAYAHLVSEKFQQKRAAHQHSNDAQNVQKSKTNSIEEPS